MGYCRDSCIGDSFDGLQELGEEFYLVISELVEEFIEVSAGVEMVSSG